MPVPVLEYVYDAHLQQKNIHGDHPLMGTRSSAIPLLAAILLTRRIMALLSGG
jgi:hypothetical protein